MLKVLAVMKMMTTMKIATMMMLDEGG